MENGFKGYGHVERRQIDSVVRKVDQMNRRETIRGKERHRKIIREVIKEDIDINDLDRKIIFHVKVDMQLSRRRFRSCCMYKYVSVS